MNKNPYIPFYVNRLSSGACLSTHSRRHAAMIRREATFAGIEVDMEYNSNDGTWRLIPVKGE